MSPLRSRYFARHLNVRRQPVTELPPGFDAEQYRDLNPDIAAAHPDDRGAQPHQVEHCVREPRRIMPDGVGTCLGAVTLLTLDGRFYMGRREEPPFDKPVAIMLILVVTDVPSKSGSYRIVMA